ncbi:MAG: hypothetical protein ABIH86_04155, partial [Planctomycetota bacterium]
MSTGRIVIQVFTFIFVFVALFGLIVWVESENKKREYEVEGIVFKSYEKEASANRDTLLNKVGTLVDRPTNFMAVKPIALKLDLSPYHFIGASRGPRIVEVRPGEQFDALVEKLGIDGRYGFMTEHEGSTYALIPPTVDETQLGTYLDSFGLTLVDRGINVELTDWMLKDIYEYIISGGELPLNGQIQTRTQLFVQQKADWESSRKNVLGTWQEFDRNLQPIEQEITKKQQQLIDDWRDNTGVIRRMELEITELENQWRVLASDNVEKMLYNTTEDQKRSIEIEIIRRKIFDLIESQLSSSTKMTSDGQVIAISNEPNYAYCWIDIGRQNGVQRGMQFTVFREENNFQKTTGIIEVAEVYATSAACKVLDKLLPTRRDPLSGYETTAESFAYSPYQGQGSDSAVLGVIFLETGDERSDRDRIIEDLRPKRETTQQESDQRGGEPTPTYLGSGMQMIRVGDRISNSLFVPILPERDYQQRVKQDLAKLEDIQLGRLSFYISDILSDTEKSFVQQMIRYNECSISSEINPDTDILIAPEVVSTLPTSSDRMQFLIGQLTQEISRLTGRADEYGDEATARSLERRQQTLEMSKAALQLGISVMTVDEAQQFFRKRRTKIKHTSGKLHQPGMKV